MKAPTSALLAVMLLLATPGWGQAVPPAAAAAGAAGQEQDAGSAAEAAGETAPAAADPAQPVVAEQVEEVESPTETEPSDYQASEQISDDLSVSYPVDI